MGSVALVMMLVGPPDESNNGRMIADGQRSIHRLQHLGKRSSDLPRGRQPERIELLAKHGIDHPRYSTTARSRPLARRLIPGGVDATIELAGTAFYALRKVRSPAPPIIDYRARPSPRMIVGEQVTPIARNALFNHFISRR